MTGLEKDRLEETAVKMCVFFRTDHTTLYGTSENTYLPPKVLTYHPKV